MEGRAKPKRFKVKRRGSLAGLSAIAQGLTAARLPVAQLRTPSIMQRACPERDTLLIPLLVITSIIFDC